jgi:uncharacterized protein YchJ
MVGQMRPRRAPSAFGLYLVRSRLAIHSNCCKPNTLTGGPELLRRSREQSFTVKLKRFMIKTEWPHLAFDCDSQPGARYKHEGQSEIASRYVQLLHHRIQGSAGHSKARCRSADHAASVAENAKNVIPLHLFKRRATGRFHGGCTQFF